MSRITIPKPCFEDLNKMTPCASGLHCGVCKTDLIDLRKKSEKEVHKILDQNPGACIIVKGKQIEQPTPKWISKTEKFFSGMKLRFVAVSFLALMVFVSSCHKKKVVTRGKFKTEPKEEIK